MSMKSVLHLPAWRVFATVCFGLALGSAAAAQPQEGEETAVPFLGHETRPWIDYRATTPFEGHARGLSEIIRARAAHEMTRAEVLKKLAEAAREQIRTREEWTHTYFRLREANRAYRAKEEAPRPTIEDVVRFAQMGKPERLSPGEFDPVTGHIDWPDTLKDAAFADGRERLEGLLTDWTDYGTLSLEHRQQIRNTTEVMLSTLRERIEELPPVEYMAARRFLESLAYEAYLAAG